MRAVGRPAEALNMFTDVNGDRLIRYFRVRKRLKKKRSENGSIGVSCIATEPAIFYHAAPMDGY